MQLITAFIFPLVKQDGILWEKIKPNNNLIGEIALRSLILLPPASLQLLLLLSSILQTSLCLFVALSLICARRQPQCLPVLWPIITALPWGRVDLTPG